MAESYMFFDSSPDDIREYTASDFAEFWADFLTDGVYTHPETKLMGLKVGISGFNLTVNKGRGIIRGYRYKSDAELSITLDGADNVLSRIDRVILKLDIVNKKISLLVKKGTMGSQPVPPTLIDNASIKELPIAQIRINAGATTGIVKDERVPVSSLIEIPFEDMATEFNQWFESKQNSIGIEVYTGAIQPENITIGDLWIKRNANNGIDILEYLGDNNFERLNKNIIVSPNDAVLEEMEDGDIHIKYE